MGRRYLLAHEIQEYRTVLASASGTAGSRSSNKVKTQSVTLPLFPCWLLLWAELRLPPNSEVNVLTPSTSECNCSLWWSLFIGS